jgi:glycosyltransferase involved in cell wall biosynthesis
MEILMNRYNVAVITAPLEDIVMETILGGFLKILFPLSNLIFAITGEIPDNFNGRVEFINLKRPRSSNSRIVKIKDYLKVQILISVKLFGLFRKVDVVFFFIGSRTYFIPMLILKSMRIKTVTIAAGSIAQQSKYYYHNKSRLIQVLLPPIKKFTEELTYKLSDQVVVNTKNVMHLLGLNKYKSKIVFLSDQFIDTNLLKISSNIKQRDNIVGYMGRLMEEKGVINFINCMPILLNRNMTLKFFVGGGGPLFDELKGEVKRNLIDSKVEFSGWYNRNQLGSYLNRLKLLVIPSYSEGGPYIALEAMACGTPVLCTKVGFLPDLIKDGDNGFFMENNSASCIAMNVERVLNCFDLVAVVEKAMKTVNRYSYQNIIKSYEKFFNEL